jgi:dTDP-4-dehydrorhamnose reductase
VVIGSTGQLGTDLIKVLQRGHEVIGLVHKEVEVSDYNSCLTLKNYQPDVIINTAAFHKTDLCEDEPLRAFMINSIGAKNISTLSKEIGATSVFISTDYVFSGSKESPYTEDDIPIPINAYGISKLAGEFFTMQNPRHYVFRVASLFGIAGASGKGGNFVETMITKAKANETISVVDDMWMSPTNTKDASVVMNEIIGRNLPFGVWHATNGGYCTWFQFAKEIFTLTNLKPDLKSIETKQLQYKAKRPRFSALQSVKLLEYNIKVRKWKEALLDYLTEKGHILKF